MPPPQTRSNSAHRPLKTRDTRWARTLAAWLAGRSVPPNGISLARLGFATPGAAALLGAANLGSAGRALLFLLAAACIQLRLLCNLLAGMVAAEGGRGSRSGELYNEVPDRRADPLLIVPAGYATGLAWGPELGWLGGLLDLRTAYRPSTA